MAGAFIPLQKGSENPELAAALGDMVIAWQNAEREQIAAFAVLLNTKHYMASRLYQKLPNFRSRTQAMLMLIELHPEFEPIKPCVLKISSLSKTRNRWIHGMLIRGWFGTELRIVDLDEPLGSENRSKPIKAADIHNHADAVRRAALNLTEVITGLPAYGVWSVAQSPNPEKDPYHPSNRPGGQTPPSETQD